MKFWFKKIHPRAAEPASQPPPAAIAEPKQRAKGEIAPLNRNVASREMAHTSHIAVTDWTPGQELLGDFVVERTLGEGGMGKVYLVLSRSTGARFALKRAKGLTDFNSPNLPRRTPDLD